MQTHEIDDSGRTISPFLSRFATKRTVSPEIPGYYCEYKDVWVVDTASGPRPLIDVAAEIGELVTKTMVQQEADDKHPTALLDLTTKTDGNAERDDAATYGAALLVLTTKTSAQLERDDIDPAILI